MSMSRRDIFKTLVVVPLVRLNPGWTPASTSLGEGPRMRPVFNDGSVGEWVRSEVVEITNRGLLATYRADSEIFKFHEAGVVIGAETDVRGVVKFISPRHVMSGDSMQLHESWELFG